MIRQDMEARTTFLTTFDWLIAVTNRYASPIEFGLVHISFGTQNELGEAYGAQDAAKQLAQLTNTLINAFRKTDLVARTGTDYWIIVPYSPATETILDKVVGILESAEHDGLHVVDRKASIFTLSSLLKELEKNVAGLPALDMLAYLKENRKTLAKHMFILPSVGKPRVSLA